MPVTAAAVFCPMTKFWKKIQKPEVKPRTTNISFSYTSSHFDGTVATITDENTMICTVERVQGKLHATSATQKPILFALYMQAVRVQNIKLYW